MNTDDFDDEFEEAVNICCEYGKAAASLLQRRLSIGYARAARILDQLEQAGVISAPEGSKPREVLIKSFKDLDLTFERKSTVRQLDGILEMKWEHKKLDNAYLSHFQDKHFNGSEIYLPLGMEGLTKIHLANEKLGDLGSIGVIGMPIGPMREYVSKMLETMVNTYNADTLKLIVSDFSGGGMRNIKGVANLLTPVITEWDKQLSALKWAMNEMENRHKLFKEVNVANIDLYNQLPDVQAIPTILIVADGSGWPDSDLMDTIRRLVNHGTCAGIYLIYVTNDLEEKGTKRMFEMLNTKIIFKIGSRFLMEELGVAENETLGKNEMMFIPAYGNSRKINVF